jgi:uncharacterized protein (TIGR03067 family)
MPRVCLSVLVLTFAAFPVSGSRFQAVSLEGTWEIVSVEFFGSATQDAAGGRWAFHGGRLSGAAETQVVLYPDGGMPRRVDLVPLGGPDRGTVFRGIYAVSGDTLKLCVSCARGGKRERPAVFATRPAEGDDVYLWVLKRVKP